jgi:hypothetical protein
MKPLYLLEKIAHPTDGHWQDPHRLQLQCAKLQQDYTPIRMDQDTPTKGGGSQPDPFGFIVQTRIVMHVLIIFIRVSKMTCINKAFEGQSKIILDIHGFVVHQGCPCHPSNGRTHLGLQEPQMASQTNCRC